jgi:hypothetical protein
MRTLFLIFFCGVALTAFSQNTSQYENIPLNTATEYRRAEPQVILASDYVYSTPIDKEDINRKNSITFIMKWMQGTSDYAFGMDETIRKVAYGDSEVLGLYFVCLAKYALSKGKSVDREELKYNAYVLLAKYCENSGNNYKPKGEMKKFLEAYNQNKLKEYLDSKTKKP